MFKCDKCQLITKPGETMTKKVVEKRFLPKGWEIVTELQFCNYCAGIEKLPPAHLHFEGILSDDCITTNEELNKSLDDFYKLTKLWDFLP